MKLKLYIISLFFVAFAASGAQTPLYVGRFTGNGAGLTNINGTNTATDGTIYSTNVWDASNVKFWGAVGNGIADDTAAIQAALNYATNSGKKIFVPAGTYNVTSLTMRGFGVSLEGEAAASGAFGNLGSVLSVSGANYGLVVGDRTNDVQYGFTVKNLTIVGTSSGLAGIRLGAVTSETNNNIARVTLENVRITGFSSPTAVHTVPTGEPSVTGGCGILIVRANTGDFRDVYCKQNYYGLIESSAHTSTTCSFSDCNFRENLSAGVLVTAGVSYRFKDSVFEANNIEGLRVDGNATGCTYLSVIGSHFEGNCLTNGIAQAFFGNINFLSLRDINISGNTNGVWATNVLFGVVDNVLQQNTAAANIVTTNCDGLLVWTHDTATSPASSTNVFDLTGTTELKVKTAGGLSVHNQLTVEAGDVVLDNARSLKFLDSGAVARINVNVDGGDNLNLSAASAGGDIYFRPISTAASTVVIRSGGKVGINDPGTIAQLNVGGDIIASTTITATNCFLLPTNYVAANFVPVAGMVKIASSNGAIYSVTQLSTNLIAGP